MPNPAPLRDHAYASFTDKLLSRAIALGQIVSQRELVELTGMPLGAIREMIPRLEADGLISTEPKRGLKVLSIDLKLVSDAVQLRQIIETAALIHFCQTAEDSVIGELYDRHMQVLEQARSSIDDDLRDHAQQVDWGFHEQLVEHMGNKIMSEVYRVNSIKIRLIANANARISSERIVAVMEEHMPILEALKNRDKTTAVAALDNHLKSARRRALRP